MYKGKLGDHQHEKWVKKILKTNDPGPLAELIEERIKWPVSTGPLIPLNSDEKPVDILTAMIASIPSFRRKIELAVGLMLYKMLNKKMNEKADFLTGAFTLIRDNNLTNCGVLVFDWINKNVQYLKADNKQGVELYNYALFTFGSIQIKSENMEKYWLDLWHNAKPQFWPAAFSGLRKQNIETAMDELPLLINRNTDKIGPHLAAILSDSNSWPVLRNELKSGLAKDKEYCGIAVNALLSKLSKPEQHRVIAELQANGDNTTN